MRGPTMIGGSVMYARIARFEDIEPGRIDEQVVQMRQQTQAVRSGNLPEDSPAEVRTLVETVTRFIYLVDRDKGTGLGISFSETEDDMRRADEAMNQMNPAAGDGRRTGVEIYEVAMDEAFH
jgi:hypothetical protein